MSDFDDLEFEREIEEAKRWSIVERRLNANVGERNVDDIGETSEMMKVMVVLYLAESGLVLGGELATRNYSVFCQSNLLELSRL